MRIIHGDANGADSLASQYARDRDIPQLAFPAQWRRPDPNNPEKTIYIPYAGNERNQQMLDEAKPTLVVAFPGGSGTADMVVRAEKSRMFQFCRSIPKNR